MDGLRFECPSLEPQVMVILLQTHRAEHFQRGGEEVREKVALEYREWGRPAIAQPAKNKEPAFSPHSPWTQCHRPHEYYVAIAGRVAHYRM
jgi:hypothetical protein